VSLSSRPHVAQLKKRTERRAQIVTIANEVFQDADKARRFLRTPHPELKARTPLSKASSESGAHQVEILLWQIAHGIPR
jgi:putative toxin-antitoxin system antitoxin component (TIGR02293 family)